ncbi:MAG: hypothetical protein BGO82_11150 [Devosia sp. 67-54]|uniref:hypothetical protein n=1 Tax=unclassified Devosia TaxID=196773 RepID=UPI000967CB63|nr:MULTISPECIES: hypothetical protein [unclassified Devosia]MBN9304803.1 hypothetical protein [Devosia sp.]OJX15236.1 MAG: hypothetical protein BGO82_11150 [Devosia sp. 67-54]
MAHPEVTSKKSADGKLESVTVGWLEAEGQGFFKTGWQRYSYATPTISMVDIRRALTIRIDGRLIAENGLPLDDYKGTGNLAANKPPLMFKTTFHMVDTIDFAPSSKYMPGRQIPDYLLSLIRTDGTPIHLSWSMFGPEHFQPVVVMLHDVFDRMRPLIAPTAEPPRSALDDIFGDS